MKILFVALIAVAALATSATAEIERRICTFPSLSGEAIGSIGSEFNTENGVAKIYFPDDPETSAEFVEVSDNSDKRLTLTWELTIKDASGTQAKLAFRLVHIKQNNRGLLRWDAIGFTNQKTYRGTCQRVA